MLVSTILASALLPLALARVTTYGRYSTISLGNIDLKAAKVFELTNVALDGTLFTRQHGLGDQVGILEGNSEHGRFGEWEGWDDPSGNWVFRNRGTRKWLQVSEDQDHLITGESPPDLFGFEPVSGPRWTLEVMLANSDKVWEVVRNDSAATDGVNMGAMYKVRCIAPRTSRCARAGLEFAGVPLVKGPVSVALAVALVALVALAVAFVAILDNKGEGVSSFEPAAVNLDHSGIRGDWSSLDKIHRPH
ncbi:hypothetical protein C8R43DRAFT_1198000 [Mycena crocata]|nr:hypothetical protein C8R43DRAFT_1198000 [Mycena crocata]